MTNGNKFLFYCALPASFYNLPILCCRPDRVRNRSFRSRAWGLNLAQTSVVTLVPVDIGIDAFTDHLDEKKKNILGASGRKHPHKELSLILPGQDAESPLFTGGTTGLVGSRLVIDEDPTCFYEEHSLFISLTFWYA